MHTFLHAHHTLLLWLAGSSVFTFVGTLILVPILLVRLPTDYFAHGKRHPAPWVHHHPLIRFILIFGKNMLGALFLLVGFFMLFLPGQGLLTMVMGVVFLDLPGKYRLERWLISHRAILKSVNWLRLKAHRPVLIIDTSSTPESPNLP
ncbi:MAG: hypothetical protein KKD73_13760 [Proteobacteria bacterium]|nr:hypothetical protein [Pseudomonadota bacterium]MBU1641665.1 hypothetical protein [Pseudomonadota bacterium]